MLGVREHVDRQHAIHAVARGEDARQLAGKRLGIARDIDDARRLQGRLKQANMMGPAGLIAMEDGMIGGLVQRGIAGDLDKASILEMGGHGIEPIPGSRVSEGSVRGFWTGYRALMGL